MHLMIIMIGGLMPSCTCRFQIHTQTKSEGRNSCAYRCSEHRLCRVRSLTESSYSVVLNFGSAGDPFWACNSDGGPHNEVHMLIGNDKQFALEAKVAQTIMCLAFLHSWHVAQKAHFKMLTAQRR